MSTVVLETILKKQFGINNESLEMIKASAKPFAFHKGDSILKPGQTTESCYFIERGVMRIYSIDNKGKEHTRDFRGPNEFMGNYVCLLRGQLSNSYIGAVTYGQGIELNFKEFHDNSSKSLDLCNLARLIAESNFIDKEDREYEFLHYNATQRHEQFLKKFAHIHEKIPQYMTASYLGITPSAFNRMLKSK